MANNKRRKRPQQQKIRHANPEMHAAMMELRRSSAAQPHRLRNREERQDFRRQRQRGEW